MHLEALQHTTIALAGVNCHELFTLLVTFFRKDTVIDPFSFLDAAPKVPVLLDLTHTESEEGEGKGSSVTEPVAVSSATVLIEVAPSADSKSMPSSTIVQS